MDWKERDIYGRPRNAFYWGQPAQAYMIDEADENTTYICFYDTAERMIHRIKKDGTVTTIERAWGAWENRASLSYIPINAI